MRLYIAWYPGDPVYPQYDDDCALLISPTSVANRWKVRDLPKQPQSLIVDSGGFRYSLMENAPTQKQVFERQLRLIEKTTADDVTLCQLDYPLIAPHLTSNERDRLIHRTLSNAYEFRNLAERHGVTGYARLMGTAQGFDVDSLIYCARELKHMGYQHFGIGSLALIYNAQEITDRVKAVIEVVGSGVHVFGVTGERVALRLSALGVGSVDSSRPAKAAMFNVIFSSEPFKRHCIRPTRGVHRSGSYIEEAFVCPCPACGGQANPDLLKVGKREYVFLRTLHNYYHLKLTISDAELRLTP